MIKFDKFNYQFEVAHDFFFRSLINARIISVETLSSLDRKKCYRVSARRTRKKLHT